MLDMKKAKKANRRAIPRGRVQPRRAGNAPCGGKRKERPMTPFARIVLSPVLAVLTGSCRVMFSMAVIVGLLCNGCATNPEHPSTSIGKCAQDMRIFDIRLADKVVDATSYEEVEGILGLPSYEFGSGVVHSEWVFDNGEVYEINSLSLSEIAQQGKKQPVGIMFPCWRVKRQKANAGTGRCVVATVEITSEKRPNMSYEIDVWPVGHPNAFLSVEDGTNIVIDSERFLGAGLEKVEENVRVRVRRTDCHGDQAAGRFAARRTGAGLSDPAEK